jgi:uncharacterized protein YidB (DUF937 family)
MAKGFPSLAALLGLVAVAGYQNRDKIGEWVKSMSKSNPGGVGDLVEQFKNKGLGDVADSWVGTGANKPVSEAQVGEALGGDLIDQLAKQTGLSREDLLARLSKVLPETIDKMTPDGRVAG